MAIETEKEEKPVVQKKHTAMWAKESGKSFGPCQLYQAMHIG